MLMCTMPAVGATGGRPREPLCYNFGGKSNEANEDNSGMKKGRLPRRSVGARGRSENRHGGYAGEDAEIIVEHRSTGKRGYSRMRKQSCGRR